MNNFRKLLVLLLSSTLLFTSSCKDDNDPVPVDPAYILPKLTVELEHRAGSEKFYIDSTYTNQNGDEFTANMFKYYVSNIRLVRTDNTEFLVPESYFLVNLDSVASAKFEMSLLPPGSYKSMKFLIGVDSTRNVSGAQTGALNPSLGMHWDWNTGYIFLKMEGTSPAIPGAGQNFVWHMGGFTGPNSTLREVEINFDGDILPLAFNKNPEVHLAVDVMEIFDTPTLIDLSTFSTFIMSAGPNAVTLADNYSDMFTYDHMHAD